MPIVSIKNLTKDYGENRGIFDISLDIEEGEVFGFVGTNGSGKTTTIRHLMGFIKADSGTCTIDGYDCWDQSFDIKKYVGYIPGEIAFPDIKTGTEFLKIQAEYLGVKDFTYINYLIKKLQLDPSANLKMMSKGMKQKTAIVAALMADSKILIFDEPTTGLDPLMRASFLEIINEEKRKGKTIFMSSHLFDEIEDTCDKIAVINDGRIVDIAVMDQIRHHNIRTFKIEFSNKKDYEDYISQTDNVVDKKEELSQITIEFNDENINELMTTLKKYSLKFISEKKYNLEQYFNELYRGDYRND